MTTNEISLEKVKQIRKDIYWKELRNQKSKNPKDDSQMVDLIIHTIKQYADKVIG